MKKMTFLGIFITFFSFLTVIGMDSEVSEITQRLDTTELTNQGSYFEIESYEATPMEKLSAITGELPSERYAAPANDNAPYKNFTKRPIGVPPVKGLPPIRTVPTAEMQDKYGYASKWAPVDSDNESDEEQETHYYSKTPLNIAHAEEPEKNELSPRGLSAFIATVNQQKWRKKAPKNLPHERSASISSPIPHCVSVVKAPTEHDTTLLRDTYFRTISPIEANKQRLSRHSSLSRFSSETQSNISVQTSTPNPTASGYGLPAFLRNSYITRTTSYSDNLPTITDSHGVRVYRERFPTSTTSTPTPGQAKSDRHLPWLQERAESQASESTSTVLPEIPTRYHRVPSEPSGLAQIGKKGVRSQSTPLAPTRVSEKKSLLTRLLPSLNSNKKSE